MKTLKALLIPCILLLTTAGAMAQPQAKPQPPKATETHSTKQVPDFFRLTFVVKDLRGTKIIDSRSYKIEISATPVGIRPATMDWTSHRSIRVTDQVPYKSPGGMYHYVDEGVNIDCSSPVIIGRKLAMMVVTDISNAVNVNLHKATADAPSPSLTPIIRQNRWGSEVLIPIGKPSVLFTSDDPASSRTLELDVIATPIH